MSLLLVPALRGRPVGQSISIAANDNTVSVVQGSTVDIIYTLTRNGGYTGTVTPAVTGLPSGVSGAWSDSSLAGADTTTTLTLTATGGATVVTNDPFTVTFSGSGVSDAVDSAATVSVTASSGFTPNLPGGLTLITDTTFDSTKVGVGADFSKSSGLAVTVQYNDATMGSRFSTGGSGPYSSTDLEIYYPPNYTNTGDGAGRLEGATGNSWKQIYQAVSILIPNNYRIHSGGEKFWYGYQTVGGNSSSNQVVIDWLVEPVGQSPTGSDFALSINPNLTAGELYALDADPPAIHGNGTWSTIYQMPSPFTYIQKGSYQNIEFYFNQNTGTNFDGTVKIWVNGTLVINRSNIRFATSDAVFNQIRLDWTRGGGSDSAPIGASGQSKFLNRLAFYASTTRAA